MRTLSLFAILLAFPAFAAERTWTIARDVYTAEAELIVVRGDLAYLKIDGQVEEIPIERLSAVDQQFIASLSLAPIAPGPQADAQESTTHSLLVQEEMPLPGEPDSPAVTREPNEPELAPEYGGAPIRRPIAREAYRVDQNGRMPYSREMGPQQGMAANYLSPQGGWGENANPNDRRARRPSQQVSGNQAANAKRDDDNDRPGLFGARARRDRQRAAAAHSR
jgi:hypothetical protein